MKTLGTWERLEALRKRRSVLGLTSQARLDGGALAMLHSIASL